MHMALTAQVFLVIAYLFSGTAVVDSASPNVILICVDDLGWTDISRHGSEYSTPNIDKLFEDGIELSNYYVHYDCSPTRAAILTGKYAWKTGLQSIQTVGPGTTIHIPFNTPTVAELLKFSGYDTYGIGKWHLGYAAWNMTGTGRGFNQYFGMFQGEQFYYNHTLQVGGNTTADKQFEGFDFFDNQEVYYDAIGNYSNDLYRNKVIEVLDKHSATHYSTNKPFFIYLATQTVHEPIEMPPKSYDTCSDNKFNSPLGGMREVYCNKILYLDESIGTIISTLKSTGLYNNTLIALTADNGGMPYWINDNTPYPMALSYGCNWPYRAGKTTLFEGGIKGVGLLSNTNLLPSNLLNGSVDILSHASDWLRTIVEGVAQGNITELMGEYTDYTMDNEFDSLDIWQYLMQLSEQKRMESVDNTDMHSNNAEWNRTILYANIDTGHKTVNGIGHEWAVIAHNVENGKVWKYISGKQTYTNYYLCNQTSWNNMSTNYTENKWLFELRSNPYEYESQNLIKEYPDIAEMLEKKIKYQIENGGFIPDQNATFYEESLPMFHNNVWMPWL